MCFILFFIIIFFCNFIPFNFIAFGFLFIFGPYSFNSYILILFLIIFFYFVPQHLISFNFFFSFGSHSFNKFFIYPFLVFFFSNLAPNYFNSFFISCLVCIVWVLIFVFTIRYFTLLFFHGCLFQHGSSLLKIDFFFQIYHLTFGY
jgi:hypothetical protein